MEIAHDCLGGWELSYKASRSCFLGYGELAKADLGLYLSCVLGCGGDLHFVGPRIGVVLVAQLSLPLVTLWTVIHQAPLFIGFSRQEYGSGLPFSPPGDSQIRE